ncbi:uncharacterized protein [Argopecten irradians]|uniref:uncharacterized protein n=1 Tax=Argopecten irradians TaxID=31199 RepID=UPI0037167EC5
MADTLRDVVPASSDNSGSDEVSEPETYRRSRRHVASIPRGRGRGRQQKATQSAPPPGRKTAVTVSKVSAAKSKKSEGHDLSIPQLKQQLGIGKIEQTLNSINKFMVKMATDKTAVCSDSSNFVPSNMAATENREAQPVIPLDPGDLFAENDQHLGHMYHGPDTDFGDQSCVDEAQSVYEPNDIFQGLCNEEDNEVGDWNVPQNEDDEHLGPNVSESLARSVNKACSCKVDSTKMEAIIKKYPIPSNCTLLTAPKVSSEIWAQLPSKSQTADVALQELKSLYH